MNVAVQGDHAGHRADEGSLKDLPPAPRNWLASAQQHFSQHEFGEAEARITAKFSPRPEQRPRARGTWRRSNCRRGNWTWPSSTSRRRSSKARANAYNLSTLGYLKFRQEI